MRGRCTGGHQVPSAREAAAEAVEPLDRGARLVFTPSDPANLDKVRQHVRLHHQQMQLGQCPMTQVQQDGRAE